MDGRRKSRQCIREPRLQYVVKENRQKKSSSLLTEDGREALLLGHGSMRSGVVHERLHVGLDHLAAAVRALCGMSAVRFCTGWWTDGGCPLFRTYNDRLLGRLDGETVGLDWGTGAGEVGLLVLALDLEGSALGDKGGSTAAAVEVARLVQEDKKNLHLLGDSHREVGLSNGLKASRIGLDEWPGCCLRGVEWRECRVSSQWPEKIRKGNMRDT